MTDKWTAILGVALGAGIAIIGLADPALRGNDAPKPTKATLFNGHWADGFSKAFDKQLWIREGAVNGWTAVSYGLFHEGRDGVLAGSHDWLYSKEEFDSPRAATAVADTVAEVKAARAALDARGIKLIVAIVPAKSRIYGENLGHYHWPSPLQPMYQDLVTSISATGTPVVDLRGTLTGVKAKELAYFRTDTHWTPAGASAAAATIAAAIKDANMLTAKPEASPLDVSPGVAKPYEGDLLTFIPLGPFRGLGPKAETIAEPVFTHAEAPAGAGDSGDGLFGDASTPVVLVGTSYSADERWGFANDLEHELGVGLANAAEKGEGPFTPMHKLLTGTTLAEAQPELVIWEIPERYTWMSAASPAGSAAKP